MVDGDNEGNPYPGSVRFVHLPVYCADNFILHPVYLASVFERSLSQVQTLILEAIVGRRDRILKRNKFFDFLIGRLQPQDITYESLGKLDGSDIIDTIAEKLGTNTSDLTYRVVSYLHTSGNLEAHIPGPLLDAVRAAVPTA